MKKTIFALLACATLVAPAMATDSYADVITPYALSDTTVDDDVAHYIYYLIDTDYSSVDNFATALKTMSYADFTTKYKGAYSTNSTTSSFSYHSLVSTKEKYIIYTMTETELEQTIYDTLVDGEDMYAVWIYDNGLTGDNKIVKFDVASIYPISGIWSTPDMGNYTTSGWTSFKTDKTPEPATATLSLLALAGLAVRRRRH